MSVDLRRAVQRRWQGYRRLPPDDRALVRRSGLVLGAAALLLKALPLRRVVALITRLIPCPPARAAGELPQAEHIVDLFVAVANLHPLRTTCLPRAVALWWLLRGSGIDAKIVLGVQPLPGAVAAHAWVEAAGRVLGDPQQVHRTYSTILAHFPRRQ
jgi:hypothetical protein